MKRRSLGQALLGLPFALSPLASRAADFPGRPVRIVLPYAAGNLMDTALRIVNEEFRVIAGQPLIIDSRPGGAGIIAAQTVASAAPDGYTLLLANTGLYAINPHTYRSLPYDPEKSFRPVTNFLGTSMVLAIRADVPAKTLPEFVSWAKAHPGSASFASYATGNPSHFAGVILNQRAGIDMVHVPFNGTPPAVSALLGGQITAAFLPLLAVLQHVNAGKLRVVAVSNPKRSPLLPDVPTFAEQGYPELSQYLWVGVLAPARTPDDVIARLNKLFTQALNAPRVREQWRDMDFEPLPSTPEEFTRFGRAESQRWAEAVKLSGFKVQD
jgi:tripartite-type tricarboxylate transporter receptor subunit TctC